MAKVPTPAKKSAPAPAGKKVTAPAPNAAKAFGKPNKDEVFEFEIPEGADGRIPPGSYEMKLVGLKKQIAKASGNNMWVFQFVVTKGPHAGQDFPVFCSLTPSAIWKLTETLTALGFEIVGGQPISFSKSDALGRMVMGEVVDDNYQGQDRSTLQKVTPHPKGAGYKPKGTTGNPFIDAQQLEEEDEEVGAPDDEELEDGDDDEEAEDDENLEEDLDEDEDEVTDEDEDEDDEPEDEDEDEEEEPAPAKRPVSTKRPVAPAPATSKKTKR